MKKSIARPLLVALPAFLLALALRHPAAQAEGVAGKHVTLLMVSGTCDYCGKASDQLKHSLEAAGVKVTVATSDYNGAQQAQQINQAISTQPDAVVVWPADGTAIVPSLIRLKAAGIPVVIENSPAATKNLSLFEAFVGPNDYAYGQAAARAMIEGFKEKGFGSKGEVIVIEGVPANYPTTERNNGFSDVLSKEAPGIKIIGTLPGNWDQPDATTAAASLFAKFGNRVDGVYGQVDPMAAGAVVAAKRAGIDPKTRVIIGSNCAIEGYDGVKAGDIYATFLQSPLTDGDLTAQTIEKVLQGKPVDKFVYMKALEIKKANAEDCAAAVGK